MVRTDLIIEKFLYTAGISADVRPKSSAMIYQTKEKGGELFRDRIIIRKDGDQHSVVNKSGEG